MWRPLLKNVARAARQGEPRGGSELDPSGQDVPEHHPVTDEGIERMLEGGGPVSLEEEMTDPCEAVTAEQGSEQVPGIAAPDCDRQQCQHPAAAYEVQATRSAIAVLAQVERVELTKARKSVHRE